MTIRRIAILFLLILGIFTVCTATPVTALTAPAAKPVFSADAEAAYGWLSAQQDSAVRDGTDTPSGLVDSFEDYSGPDQPITEAFTYDQAVAAIAFLVAGDLERATLVLDTLKDLQAEDGSWCNSYWYGGYWGAELRKHVGPAVWVALAVMNYERLTDDLETYHEMAVSALDWALQYQRPNGGIAGGETTWDVPGVWTEEVWTGTEHNLDAYPALRYFAGTTPERATTYDEAADGVLGFLEEVVWDDANDRFFGGFKNDTGLVDPYVPLDVNPWAVLALGSEYAAVLDYVDDAAGDPLSGIGTLAHPKYVQTLTYDDEGSLMTGYDFDWQDDGAAADPAKGGGTYAADIWIEGTIFMAAARYAVGDDAEGDAILSEVVKKMGAGGSMAGGLPYSLKASNNHYWRMLQQNCVSSTGWFVIAAHGWNPFQGEELDPRDRAATPAPDRSAGQYAASILVGFTSATPGAVLRYTLDGSDPDETDPVYETPLAIAATTEVRIRAYASEFSPSAVGVYRYVVDDQAQMPVFSLPSGTYAGMQFVWITTPTDGGTIRYTLDGSVPTATSSVYSQPLSISADTVVTAAVDRDDLVPSDAVRVRYVIADQTPAPTFSVEAGSFDEPVTVAILHPDEAAILRYTLDGSTPDERSPVYAGPITILQDLTLKAIAIVPGEVPSDPATATYAVDRDDLPYVWDESAGAVTIGWLEEFTYVDLHYLVDGAGQQNVRMAVDETTGRPEHTITGLDAGDVVRFWFTVMVAVQTDTEVFETTFGSTPPPTGTVAVPTADPAAGTHAAPLLVQLACTTPGAEIRYALGVPVTVAYVVYAGPIRLDADGALSFTAAAEGMADAPVTSIDYVVDAEEPEAVPPFEVIPYVPAEPVTPPPSTVPWIASIATAAVVVAVLALLVIRRRRIV